MPLIEMDNHKTNERLDKIMAAIDDLNAAIATLQTTVTSVVTALGTSGTPGTNNDAQVEVDVAAINAANAALQAALAPGTVVTTPVTAAPSYATPFANQVYPNEVGQVYPSGAVSTLHGAVVTHPVGSPTQVAVPGRADQVTGI